ncbi:hypothetical protein SPI_01418 [Niveomyces insectorum RCEF 264]|uniref:Uncharacterized protein n=1 Tax=Niveomyces insectorum RCEF 264 TaxID=1081102 RepID=A0A162JC94_9HYPO|nr:hypothetical protein SPI_01418 [Niveomyces insectorum RCEF 264]
MLDSRCPPYGYSVGLMTEYIVKASCFLLGRRPSQCVSFGILLYGFLARTQLPGTTILLGLLYLSRRVEDGRLFLRAGMAQSLRTTTPLPAAVPETQAWQQLVVAIVLGSKYLDDNSFGNASWAMASSKPQRLLDAMELEWLDDADWRLHIDLDYDNDYGAWIASWQDWLLQRTTQMTFLPHGCLAAQQHRIAAPWGHGHTDDKAGTAALPAECPAKSRAAGRNMA